MNKSPNHVKITLKKLNIIHINVNSIISLNRRYDLQKFIKNNNPDLILLNETKLNARHNIKFDNYKFIRKDRCGALRGGGTGILIKDDLKFKVYNNEIVSSFKCLETCIIKIPLSSNKSMFVISAYYPSGKNNEKLKIELQALFEALQLHKEDNFYLMAGDLNCKHTNWGNTINNSTGVALNNWISDNELRFRCTLYATVSPSYPRSSSYLDLCMADSRIFVLRENETTNCLKTLDYDSDHCALQIQIFKNSKLEPLGFLSADNEPIFNYKKTNWSKFAKVIIDSIQRDPLIPNDRNLTNIEINFHLDRISNLIIEAINKTVPKYVNKDKLHYIVNSIIKKLQSEKSKILTTIKKHNRLERLLPLNELSLAKNRLKLIRKLLRDNFINSVNDNYRRKLSKLSTNDSSQTFSMLKKQFRNQASLEILKISPGDVDLLQSANIDPLTLQTDRDNKYIIRDKENILNVTGSYLESVYAIKDIDLNNNSHVQVNDYFPLFLESKNRYVSSQSTLIQFNECTKANELSVSIANDYFIIRDDLLYIFSKLRPKLSSGIDNIPNIVLKNIPNLLICEYLTLFNNMINNAYFPDSWKLAKIVVIPKKGKDNTDPKNFRAISLLPNISKVFEICTNKMLLNNCQKLKIVCEKQFGFKFKHSTVHAINLLVSNVNWNLNKKYCTGACLIDFEKAFDNIWLPALIFKLSNYSFPSHLVFLLYEMLIEKKFVVCNKNKTSSKIFKMNNGLQQGTVNAPILFSLYIHDLLINIENIIGFADDIIIYYSNNKIEEINKNLQNSYNVVEKYAIDWNMRINVDKCEAILFRPPVGKCNFNVKTNWKKFEIKSPLNDRKIPTKDVVKYLGIYIDKFLYFNFHVNTQVEKARKAFLIYKSIFYSKYIHKDVKILLYKALVRPIITYGCAIWFNISPSYMEKIRKFERKCLRSCTSLNKSSQSNYTKFISNKKLYNSANISRIDNFIIKLIRNHILKCMECNINNLISAPYYSDDLYISNTLISGYVPPEAFIYLDKNGYIQNEEGIPIFYHLFRRASNKSFNIDIINSNELRYDTSIAELDRREGNMSRYWWISN